MSKSPLNITLINEIEKPLPVGRAEFNEFADRIISLVGPIADKDSLTFVLATEILHADSKKASFTDQHFIDRLRRVAANQVASTIAYEIKEKQAAEAAVAKLAEATASTEESPADEVKEKTY